MHLYASSKHTIAGLAITAFVFASVHPAFGVSKEIIQLQTQVQTLSDQVARLQQSMDERMGVLRNLVEQSTDSVNKMSVGGQRSAAEDPDRVLRYELPSSSRSPGRSSRCTTRSTSSRRAWRRSPSSSTTCSRAARTCRRTTRHGGCAGSACAGTGQSRSDCSASRGRAVQQCAARLQRRQIRSLVSRVRRLSEVLRNHRPGRRCAVLSRRHRVPARQLRCVP